MPQVLSLFDIRKAADALPPIKGGILEQIVAQKLFDKVCDPKDWKGPIDRTLEVGYLDVEPEVIAWAIRFMTGNETTITRPTAYQVRFESIGYRAGPAGP